MTAMKQEDQLFYDYDTDCSIIAGLPNVMDIDASLQM